jgi:tripartite-type tricarboxylate transporter receptor subunit TctC
MKSRQGLTASLLLVLAIVATGPALAQYPARSIKWIVPYPPGGITDSVTRQVTLKMGDALGHPIVIENKPGANSVIGAEVVARSAPDGYTGLTVIGGHAANATLYAGKLSFDPVKSFAPVSLVAIAPLILTVTNNFPAKDMKELIAYARANPGKISFGSSGIGAAAHLTMELLKQTAEIDMVHIPYKGTAPALTALISGDIQVLVDTPSSLMPQARGGKIRAVAMFSAKRLPGIPEVPTIVESGGPLIESSTWVMFMSPAGTPKDIVNRLSSEAAKVVAAPEMRANLEQLGIEPVGSTPEQAAKFLDDEVAKWARVIKTAGVKLEQ